MRSWILPSALAGFVVAHCVVVSNKRLLWADELLTWYPASAPFGSMVASTTDTINASPPLYYFLLWMWAQLFGNSPLALRLPSALAMVAALFFLFHVLRRTYGVLASSLALAIALTFCDPALLQQTTEARFHTLIIAEVALAILLYQRLTAWRDKVPTCLIIANAGIHACLVMTHYFGPLYSGAILAVVLLNGAIQRFNPTRAAASIILGWTVFLFWIPSFLRHQEMGKPSFWIPIPTVASLQTYYGHFISRDFGLLVAGLLLSTLAGFALVFGNRRERRKALIRFFSLRRREIPLLLLIPAIGSIPLFAYFVSTRPGSVSVFLDRYLHSVSLAWGILCAHLIHRALSAGKFSPHRRLRKILVTTQATAITAVICWGSWTLLRQGFKQRWETMGEDILSDRLGNERIIMEYSHEFLNRNFYSAQPYRYLFVVDHEAGAKEGGGGPLNHQVMAALKRHFPEYFTGVVSNDEFLANATSFWVKRGGGGTPWWPLRIEHNPLFASEAGEGDLIHVQRVGGAAENSARSPEVALPST